MKRRQVITAFGTLAVGIGAAMGTGAFTTTSAERSFTVSTAGDGAAALKISPGNGQTADTVVSNSTQDSDNVTALNFGSINQKALVAFDGILQITNNSSNSIDITELEFNAEKSNGDEVNGIFVYKTGTSDGTVDTDPIDDDSDNGKTTIQDFGGNDGATLTTGEWVEVGFLFDTRGKDSPDLETVDRIEIIAKTSTSN